MNPWEKEVIRRVTSGHRTGAALLRQAGLPVESVAVAISAERHRWAWRPESPAVVLVAESHVYTSDREAGIQLRTELLPPGAELAPTEYVRLVYCLGYGEPELLSGPLDRKDVGTRDFWGYFGRLAGEGELPHSRDTALIGRLRWRIKTLRKLRGLGVWLLDASFHAFYGYESENGRLQYPDLNELREIWLQQYGSWVLSQCPKSHVWAIGPTLKDWLVNNGVAVGGWIYQPRAARNRKIDMETGWSGLMAEIEGMKRRRR